MQKRRHGHAIIRVSRHMHPGNWQCAMAAEPALSSKHIKARWPIRRFDNRHKQAKPSRCPLGLFFFFFFFGLQGNCPPSWAMTAGSLPADFRNHSCSGQHLYQTLGSSRPVFFGQGACRQAGAGCCPLVPCQLPMPSKTSPQPAQQPATQVCCISAAAQPQRRCSCPSTGQLTGQRPVALCALWCCFVPGGAHKLSAPHPWGSGAGASADTSSGTPGQGDLSPARA